MNEQEASPEDQEPSTPTTDREPRPTVPRAPSEDTFSTEVRYTSSEVPDVIREDSCASTRPSAYDAALPLGSESPTDGPDQTPEVLEAIAVLERSLGQRLADLKSSFDREVRAETVREKIVDRLHNELQQYKQGLLRSVLKPILLDLIQFHDDIGKFAETFRAPEPGTGDAEEPQVRPREEGLALIEFVTGLQQGVQDILYRQGVEPFSVEGETFDPRRQRAISTVPTDDPDLAKRISTRVRSGFEMEDRVIRPEIVTVYSFRIAR